MFRRAEDENFHGIKVVDHKHRVFSEVDIDQIIRSRAGASTATWLVIDGEDGLPPLYATLYLTAAAQYLMSAKELEKNGGPAIIDQSPQYFLVCHSIELALKSFLVKLGKTKDDLKRMFGHDLLGLYEEAKSSGLELNYENADRDIFWINEWHAAGAGMRYDFDETRTLPICKTLFPLVDEIIATSRAHRA